MGIILLLLLMTLIATTLNQNVPFLISDLLWSGKKEDRVISTLPTSIIGQEEYLPEGEEDIPVRLGQKMYIIAKQICIIFSGFSPEIITFIKVFKSTFKNPSNLSVDRIHQFLKAYRLEEHFKESGFLLMYMNPKIKNKGFKFYVPEQEHEVELETFQIEDGVWNILKEPTFGETAAQGTGTEGFLRMVKEPIKIDSYFPPDIFLQALLTNTTLIARVLTLERVSLYTIENSWGGGFEIAYFNGKRFEKVDQIAYVINHSKFDEKGDVGLPIPMLIMYYHYVKDVLYITALEVIKYLITEEDTHTKFTSQLGEFKTTIFEVEGLDIDNINEIPMPKDFSFSTNVITMGYSLELPDKPPFNPAFFNLGPTVTVSFQQGKQVEVKIHKQISEDIRQMAIQEYPRLNKQR